jgi:hypothetical protein
MLIYERDTIVPAPSIEESSKTTQTTSETTQQQDMDVDRSSSNGQVQQLEEVQVNSIYIYSHAYSMYIHAIALDEHCKYVC